MRENRTYGLTRGLKGKGLKMSHGAFTAFPFTLLYRETNISVRLTSGYLRFCLILINHGDFTRVTLHLDEIGIARNWTPF